MKNSTYNRRSRTVSTVKQVARHDPGGLLTQERPPSGGGYPPRRRIQPVPTQHRADGGGGDPDAKLLELAFDALVAPSTGDQASVPAQQRLRPDEETRPA